MGRRLHALRQATEANNTTGVNFGRGEIKMTDAKTLKLKRQSRDKWRKIVEDLSRQGPKLHPKLDSNDCGYCEINRVEIDGCGGCCLNSERLCDGGRGGAFDVVDDFYTEYIDCVAAIEWDIKKSEKKK